MYIHFPTLKKAVRLTLKHGRKHPIHVLFAFASYGLAVLPLAVLLTILRFFDNLVFGRWRLQKVEAPVYITGNMRSGTTFMHRLMCLDDQFTFIKLFHTILPSVWFYKLFDLLGKIDNLVGAPFQKLIKFVDKRFFSHWDDIHAAGFNSAEEDEMYWVYTVLSPAIYMFFPFAGEFEEAMFVDRLPEDIRERIGSYYVDNIRRHIYSTGGKRLLAKNALKTGRFRTVLDRVPDMKVVHLVRHPYESVPSMVSMYAAVWKMHSSYLGSDCELAHDLARVAVEYYKYMHEIAQDLPDDQYVLVKYTDLVEDPYATVQRVYQQLDIPWNDDFERKLREACDAAGGYKSSHDYSLEEYGLSRDDIYEQMKDLFDYYGFDKDHGVTTGQDDQDAA